jgi:hypothetical protein
MIEIWKDVYGFEGVYQVSSWGRIKSYKRKKTNIIKPFNNGSGWMQISLSGKKFLIHRLVALIFIPNPENKPEVNHKDGIKSNNHVDNLEWVTNQENITHSILSGLKKVKLNKDIVIKMRIEYATGNYSFNSISKKYNIGSTTAREAILKIKWKHI